jgi:hypothetical protein
LANFAKDKQQLIAIRAPKSASVDHYAERNILPKPEWMKDYHTDQRTGLVVDSMGKPIQIDGHFFHADFDVQGVYAKNASGAYGPDPTDPVDDPSWVRDINAALNRDLAVQKDWVQHGVEGTYRGPPPPDAAVAVPAEPRTQPPTLSGATAMPVSKE